MANNRFKEKEKTIENWKTAPLSNVEKLKAKSRVPIPSDFEVENAKGWVDENQK